MMSTYVPSQIPDEVARVALALHRTNSLELASTAIELKLAQTKPDSKLWVTSESSIQFLNLEARNICAAYEVCRELTEEKKIESDDALFRAAYGLWRDEIGHSDFACVRLLVLARTTSDTFSAATRLIQSGEHRVFDILSVMEAALPHLEGIAANDILVLVGAQYPKTKGDLAGGLLFESIRKYLVNRPALAWELYEATKLEMADPNANLYCTALLALAASSQQAKAIDKLLEEGRSSDSKLASTAVWTVGRVLNSYCPSETQQLLCESLLVESTQHPSEQVRQSAMRSVAHAAAAPQSTLIPEVRLLSESSDQYALAVVADFLFMNFKRLKEHDQMPHLVRALTGLRAENPGAIGNYDWVLRSLLEDATHIGLVLDCLTDWFKKHGSQKPRDRELVELFDQTFAKVANVEDILGALITRWLLADEKQLAVACGELISFLWVRQFKHPRFSEKILNTASADDLKFLARRMLGYVFSEEPLLSLTFSLLSTDDASQRTHGLVHALLCQEIGRDYVHATLEAMSERSKSASAAEKSLLDSAHANLSAYVNAMENLPRLQELKPPLQLRRAIALRRSQEMRRSMDDANEKSVFHRLATQVPLKAGVGWFAVTNGRVSETHRLESFSHQTSLPRRALLDPIGYAITGIGCRVAKRGDH
jgi:hypothetical protein